MRSEWQLLSTFCCERRGTQGDLWKISLVKSHFLYRFFPFGKSTREEKVGSLSKGVDCSYVNLFSCCFINSFFLTAVDKPVESVENSASSTDISQNFPETKPLNRGSNVPASPLRNDCVTVLRKQTKKIVMSYFLPEKFRKTVILFPVTQRQRRQGQIFL